MTRFTFDVKAFVTVHVTAPDEKTARFIADCCVEGIEGVQYNEAADRSAEINCASVDGESELTEVDGEAV